MIKLARNNSLKADTAEYVDTKNVIVNESASDGSTEITLTTATSIIILACGMWQECRMVHQITAVHPR